MNLRGVVIQFNTTAEGRKVKELLRDMGEEVVFGIVLPVSSTKYVRYVLGAWINSGNNPKNLPVIYAKDFLYEN